MDINVSTLVSYNLIFIVAISIDISEHFLLWKQIKKEARNDQASEALIKRRYHRVLAHVQFDTTQRTTDEPCQFIKYRHTFRVKLMP